MKAWLPLLVLAALVVAACTDVGHDREPWSSVPERAMAIAAVQRDAGDAYRLTLQNGVAQARLADLAIDIDAAGCRIAAGHVRTSLRLEGVGRGIAWMPPHPGTLRVEANRAEIRRDDFVEWYVSGPLGLEQGFTFETRPLGDGLLFVHLGIGGAQPKMEEDRAKWTAGSHTLFYGELYAFDADGRSLPAKMTEDDGILITVDDTWATYPITIDPLLWVARQTLVAPSPANFDRFGGAVAIAGDVAVVGAAGDDHSGQLQVGSAYLFNRNTGSFAGGQELMASTLLDDAGFGSAVAISDDTILVGAPGELNNAGSAYVFRRDGGGTWTEEQRLRASDPANGARFGDAVSIDGDTLVVGSSSATGPGLVRVGAAYVFTRSGDTWTELQKITSSDGAAFDAFAFSVDIEGDTLIAGARGADPGGINAAGAAYVFERAGGSFSEQQKLVSTRTATRFFGESVSLSGDTVLIGAPLSDGQAGAGFVFVRSGGTWSEQAKLTSAEISFLGELATVVALEGDTAVLAAEKDDNGNGVTAGSAFIFRRTGDVWTEEQVVIAPEGAASDRFGASVSIAGDDLLVGASDRDDEALMATGAVYTFVLTGGGCTVDSDCASTFCEDGVCCQTACPNACDSCATPGSEGTCTPTSAFGPGAPSCAPFLCDGFDVTCPQTCTDDDQCSDDAYCLRPGGATTGVCAFQLEDDSPCASANQCVSGSCIEGVCCGLCDRACSGCADGICGPAAEGSPGGCASYVCDGVSLDCPTQCDDDSACPERFRCDTLSGECTDAQVCDGDHTLVGGDTEPTDCSPFRCGARGQCLNPCGSTADCIDGFLCSPGGTCSARSDPVSFGCAMGRGGPPAWGWLPILAGLHALLWRRRRRDRRRRDRRGFGRRTRRR